MRPLRVRGDDEGEKWYVERQRPFQKFAGEYLFETRWRVIVLGEEGEGAQTAVVAEG